MQSVSQIEDHLKFVMEERVRVLARETGCIQRERKFDGADLLQTLVFGWLAHPDGSLEHLASTAAIRVRLTHIVSGREYPHRGQAHAG
jgi:hypothetical protein